jgi:hypothetical protein
MKATTLFTWGYYGWGNHTEELVVAVDAVETSRGFEPPIFVDIRFRRTVRAKGFQGSNFEKLLGQSSHRWMKGLGNKFILTRTGPIVQIADPSAANELLDLALESATHKQRLLFFCSCQWPKFDGEPACHRTTVAELVLKAARKRSAALEIVEWPGGKPKQIELDVTPEVFAAVRRGRKTVPLCKQPDLPEVAGLPWCSTVTLKSNAETLHRVVGPAIRQPDQWVLPIMSDPLDASATIADYRNEAEGLRRRLGVNGSASFDGGG